MEKHSNTGIDKKDDPVFMKEVEKLVKDTLGHIREREKRLMNLRIKMLELYILTLTAELVLFSKYATDKMGVMVTTMFLSIFSLIMVLYIDASRCVGKKEYVDTLEMMTSGKIPIIGIKFDFIDYFSIGMYVISVLVFASNF